MSTSDRAYATWSIKSIDDEQRIIEGIASTPSTDRDGDVMEPGGAKYTLPLPLLWQHRHDQPIGHVLSATVTKAGIAIRARIAKDVHPRIDEAWGLIKSGLVRGLSIGFRAIDVDRLEGGFGLHIKTWDWFELSAVTVPANADASIRNIKSFDAHASALSGGADRVTSDHPPAVAGRVKANTSMNLSEKIAAKQAALKQKSVEIDAFNALDTLTAEQRTERDTLSGDIAELASDLKALKAQEMAQAGLAVAVAPIKPAGSVVHDVTQVSNPTPVELPKGIGFARYAIVKMAAHLMGASPMEIAKARYPDDPRIQTLIKAAVAGGSTVSGGSNWGSQLVDAQTLVSEFIEYLRPQTILGRIDGLRRVPFNVRITGQNAAMAGYWVGQQDHKPVTKAGYSAVTLGWAKVAAISVISDELARFSNPAAETLVRDELARALTERLDIDFVDPDKAADAGVSPASITNGVGPLTSAGSTAAAVRSDVNQLFGAFIAANINPTSGVFIMPNTVALALSLMQNPLGQPEFPGISMNGGTFFGLPVVTSQYATFGSPNNNILVLANASDIFLSDDGQVSVDLSREASIRMASDPEGEDSSADYVSMFQTNQIALKAERYINWARRRAAAVAWIENVSYSPVNES